MFTRIKTVKGHRYLMLERRWREQGKVRSQSWSLGPVDGAISYGKPTNLGHGGYQEQMREYPEKEVAPEGATPATQVSSESQHSTPADASD